MVDEVKAAKVRKIVESFEDDSISAEKATSQINMLIDGELDREHLETYWSSQSLYDFVNELCINHIDNWRTLAKEDRLKMIQEILDDPGNSILAIRNGTALDKFYGKPSGKTLDLVFQANPNSTPNQILEELKKDTRIYL